jgi:predicted Zn-dependent protease
MKTAAVHFALLALSFFGLWFLLSRVDFVGMLSIEKFSRENEKKLSELVLDAIQLNHEAIEDEKVARCLDSIKARICTGNAIADTSITLHIVDQDDVNAFALPDRQIVVNAGLIRYCETPEELAGVLAHEIAHIEQRHVMQKLVKEVGFMMLLTIANDETGSGIMRQVIKTLSSTAFDREQESQADSSAVRYLSNAGIDPEAFATFLFRIARDGRDVPKRFELLSTHPNSSDRAAVILKMRKEMQFTGTALTDPEAWKAVQKRVSPHRDK